MSGVNDQQVAVFSELVEANRSRVFGYIYAMLHNLSDAEDVYQQTTILLWEKFGEFRPGSDFGSWALKTAYYNIKNFQRKQSRSRVFFSDAVMQKVTDSYGLIDSQEDSEWKSALRSCLKSLSEKNQHLLRMRYAEDKPVKSLAEDQSKSVPAISMMLVRIRRSLLRCIKSQVAAG